VRGWRGTGKQLALRALRPFCIFLTLGACMHTRSAEMMILRTLGGYIRKLGEQVDVRPVG